MSVENLIPKFIEGRNPERVEIGTGAVIKQEEDFLFVLSKEKYWNKKKEMTHLSFQNVGGAVEKGEKPIQALKREAKEELDAEIKIENSEKTIVTSPKIEFEPSDNSSLMIYTEENPGKPGKPEVEGTWTLLGFLYQAKLIDKQKPTSEIPATIKIPEKLFLKSKNGLTREQIEQKGEIKTQRPLPKKFKAKPKFSAKKMLENYRKISLN